MTKKSHQFATKIDHFGRLRGSPNFKTHSTEYRHLKLSQVTNIYAYISDGDSTYTTGIRAQWNTVFGSVQVPATGQTYWEVEVTSLGLLPEFANALHCLYHFISLFISVYISLYLFLLVAFWEAVQLPALVLKSVAVPQSFFVSLSCGRYRQS